MKDVQLISTIAGHVMQGAMDRLNVPDVLAATPGSHPPQVAFRVEPGLGWAINLSWMPAGSERLHYCAQVFSSKELQQMKLKDSQVFADRFLDHAIPLAPRNS